MFDLLNEKTIIIKLHAGVNVTWNNNCLPFDFSDRKTIANQVYMRIFRSMIDCKIWTGTKSAQRTRLYCVSCKTRND